MKKGIKFNVNAPVVLGMTLVAFCLQLVIQLTGTPVLYGLGLHFSAWWDPLMYLRMFTHIFVHGDFAHFTSNFMLLLAVGPMVEEKYGSKSLAVMIAVTAFVTGLVFVLFFRSYHLVGASGVVFMLILLASFVNIKQGEVPVTVLLVAVLFIGNEIITAVRADDNISQLSHIVGGLCGAAFGFLLWRGKGKRQDC